MDGLIYCFVRFVVVFLYVIQAMGTGSSKKKKKENICNLTYLHLTFDLLYYWFELKLAVMY